MTVLLHTAFHQFICFTFTQLTCLYVGAPLSVWHRCLRSLQVPVGEAAVNKQLELRYMGIIITKLLLEHNEKWFSEKEQQLLVRPIGGLLCQAP